MSDRQLAESISRVEDVLKTTVTIDGLPLYDPTEDYDDLVGLFNGGLDETTLLKRLENPPDLNGVLAWTSWEDFIYSHKELYAVEMISRNLDYETILNKTSAPADAVACPKCGSTNTFISGRYHRSADEAGISESICRNCGKKFQDE